ncbi:phospholipid/cholesterol/gamma-HCH transport system substrate-binding protein [Mucilaginibacter gracilis]|uniref:Phospholipid/cholesterol/gamma-HCH transport system substrate-binding protein n=1 Tax=Mucilaginibacter gracilis TaxID=423350 RepID=A0A495JAR2_9SPHI|nr:MlaD family protein [Mucilaginibacter gracilis]RKR85494.1 phospholipid/cholesterol/gamma-HCH transport system substrate-binding protein [Mucilaginibacter gracilis]
MEKDENKRAIIVGIFIFLGLAIIILAIFTLGGQQKTFVKNIHLNAVFNDVQGLKKGNNVWFSGVKVGTISSIKFTGIAQVDVKMDVDQAIQTYIHRNAGAKISSDGLIGNKIIVIEPGSPGAPMIEDNDMLQVENTLSTDDIMKTLQKNNENLLAITTDFKKLSHQIVEGKSLVGALMADSNLALKFKQIVGNLQNTTSNTAKMANQLNAFSGKMNTKGGLADKLLTDTSVFRQLQLSVLQLRQAAANATNLTDNLTRASNKLNTTDNVLGVLLNDPKQAEQMKSTLNYLNQSTIKLNDDLEAAQHNFLLKGFFKKKAKAEAEAKK